MKTLPVLAAIAFAFAGCNRAAEKPRETPDAMPGESEDTRPYAGVAPDETVRFTGTEPFWGGQVSGERLTYTTPENIDGTTFAVQRFAGRGGVSWDGLLDGRTFRMSVTEGACSDGMSDRTYPFTATLRLGDETRNGCAWTARRPFQPSDEDRAAASAKPAPAPLAGADVVRAEWSKAENRATCDPVSFSKGAERGTARPANFGGGWAVAWDLPDNRSAFGIAGTGFVPDRGDDPKVQRARLAAQWPNFLELTGVPRPAYAGFGVEGAGDYPSGNPDGVGLKSLAYARIAGQACDYNVWSSLGRAHLETLLEGLRMVEK